MAENLLVEDFLEEAALLVLAEASAVDSPASGPPQLASIMLPSIAEAKRIFETFMFNLSRSYCFIKKHINRDF
jgi:hypothetical protein